MCCFGHYDEKLIECQDWFKNVVIILKFQFSPGNLEIHQLKNLFTNSLSNTFKNVYILACGAIFFSMDIGIKISDNFVPRICLVSLKF